MFYKLCYTFLFQFVEIPVPSLKKNEILIKIEAASLNQADWRIQKGLMRPFHPKFPFIPGTYNFWSNSFRSFFFCFSP